MTRTEAEAFLELPDRSRVKILRSLNPSERQEAFLALIFGLAQPEETKLAA
jgi:hypothetical protein